MADAPKGAAEILLGVLAVAGIAVFILVKVAE